MNEVSKINLGRQAFTIAADAHSELRSYLDDIGSQVRDKDVIYEVEVRMAELLTDRGISGEKVILKNDVEFLKSQLGSPKDFKDEGSEENFYEHESSANKRLFRDTSSAMVAGVAAGLSQYFGIDVLLIRILFVFLLLVTFGWGVLIYILLWLLVPEAKTASERLQMSGRAVTVKSLKGVAKSADIKGVAKRTNASLAEPINRAFNVILKVCGGLLAIGGLSLIFGLIAGLVYFLTESSRWAKYNIFPIGTTEHILLYLAMAVTALIAVFVILFGIAIFRRKWPIGNWVTGTLLGLTLVGMTVCGALSATVYPTVRDAYNSNTHTTTRTLTPFTSVNTSNDTIWNTNYVYASTYYVTLNYFDRPDLSTVSTTVTNKVLNINTNQFNWQRNCPILCIPNTYNLSITIHSPNFLELQNESSPSPYPYVNPQPQKLWRM